SGQRTITQIKEEMQKIDKLCQEAQELVEEFPIISKVSRIHKNFLAVEEMKRNLNELDAKLNLVDDMLRDDYGEGIHALHNPRIATRDANRMDRYQQPNAQPIAYTLLHYTTPRFRIRSTSQSRRGA